jgi:outer membrane cobalamin receptor
MLNTVKFENSMFLKRTCSFSGILIFLFLLRSFESKAQSLDSLDQSDTIGILDLDLKGLTELTNTGEYSEIEKLMAGKSYTGNINSVSIKKLPYSITIITEDEIRRSGAKDLSDIIRAQSDFEIIYNRKGVSTIAYNGLDVSEGRFLILINGMETNDLLYNSLQIISHFNVDDIIKIEIIKGPIASRFGGLASYGAMNIVTRSSQRFNGFHISTNANFSSKSLNNGNGGFTYGFNSKDFHATGIFYDGRNLLTDQKVNLFSAKNIAPIRSLSDTVRRVILPLNYQIDLNYKNLNLKVHSENFRSQYSELKSDTTAQTKGNNFNSKLYELSYLLKLNKKISLSSYLRSRFSSPWLTKNEFEKNAYRRSVGILGNLNLIKNWSYNFGLEVLNDHSKIISDNTVLSYFGKNNLNFTNIYFFDEINFKKGNFNVQYLQRFEVLEYYKKDGLKHSPKLGVAYNWENLNLKINLGSAYRFPGLDMLVYTAQKKLNPEQNYNMELEAGYKITEDFLVRLNLYKIIINNAITPIQIENSSFKKTITYYNDSLKNELQGLQLNTLYKTKYTSISLSLFTYSNYDQTDRKTFLQAKGFYKNLGISQRKLVLNLNHSFTKKYNANIKYIYTGERVGALRNGNIILIKKYEPTHVIDAFVTAEKLFGNNASLSLGVHDLLNQAPVSIQSYFGAELEHPTFGRSFHVKWIFFIPTKKGETLYKD